MKAGQSSSRRRPEVSSFRRRRGGALGPNRPQVLVATPNLNLLPKSLRWDARTRPRPFRQITEQLRKLVERSHLQREHQGEAKEQFDSGQGGSEVTLTHRQQQSFWSWPPQLRRYLPDFASGADVALALLPVLKNVALGAIQTLLSRRAPFASAARRREWSESASANATEVSEQMQDIFFQRTWLDSWTVKTVCRLSRGVGTTLRLALRLDKHLRPWQARVAQRRIDSIPRSGYETFMLAYLLIGQAMGYFRGGAGRVRLVQIDDYLFPGKSTGQIHIDAINPPHSPSDALQDIDSLYWTGARGAVVKIVRVGVSPDPSRTPRWIVVLPGTDHISPVTTANPADFQSNIYEVLGYPSTMREGVRRAILAAMAECGITGEQVSRQQVLMVGHSQGGLIGSALAISKDVPFRIVGLLSAGAPIGRVPVDPKIVQVALRHDQDVVYSLDGKEGKLAPSIVLLTRSLEKPRRSALYYAHSAGTYVETARLMEQWAQEEPNSAVGQACHFLTQFFPSESEPCLTFFYELTQEVVSAPLAPTLQIQNLNIGTANAAKAPSVAGPNVTVEDEIFEGEGNHHV